MQEAEADIAELLALKKAAVAARALKRAEAAAEELKRTAAAARELTEREMARLREAEADPDGQVAWEMAEL